MTQPAVQPRTQSQPHTRPQASPQGAWRTSERALIGTILSMGASGKGRQTFAEAVDATGIVFRDFADQSLSAVWFVMDRLYQDGKDINLSTVWAEVQKSAKAQEFISMDLLTYLADQTVGGHRTHAENVVDAAVSNYIRQSIQQLQPLLDNPKVKAAEKLRRINKIITDLSQRTEHASKSQTVGFIEGMQDFIAQFQAHPERVTDTGTPTGFPRLDHYIDGWKKRTLNIIAGPPGSGKTVMLMNCAVHAVMHGKKVLVIQLELPQDQSMRRMICAFAGIDSNRLKRNTLTATELSRLAKATEKLKHYDKDRRFTLLTMNQPTLEDIKIKLDTLMLRGYDLVFFDYAGGAKIARSNARQDDLEHHREIYNAIDDWKKTYNVPIVAGAQYGHPHPQKHPGAYTMDMIYSSKYLKHNADTITFIHPNKQQGDSTPQASLVVVKNRDGEKPYGNNLIVHTRAEMNLFRFVDATIPTMPGPPPPLWTIHEHNQPRTDDELKDL